MGATTGQRTWFSELMGGVLLAPRSVDRLVRKRRFTEAQQASTSRALRLMTTTVLRPGIRQDLRHMMPNGMEVYTIRSRCATMAAHLTNSQVDMVPANFEAVLLSHIRHLLPTDASIRAIQTLCRSAFTLDELVDTLRRVESSNSTIVPSEDSVLQRVVARIREASTHCPVCLVDDCGGVAEGCTAPRIFGCCGYVVCDRCHELVDRCPFCRTAVETDLPRASVPVASSSDSQAREVINLDSEDEDDEATGAPPTYARRPRVVLTGDDMAADVSRCTSPEAKQVSNLVQVLHVLQHYGSHRVIMVVESHWAQMLSRNLDNYVNLPAIGRATGFKIHRVDTLLNGKGSKFASVKREFDDPQAPPQVLSVLASALPSCTAPTSRWRRRS